MVPVTSVDGVEPNLLIAWIRETLTIPWKIHYHISKSE